MASTCPPSFSISGPLLTSPSPHAEPSASASANAVAEASSNVLFPSYRYNAKNFWLEYSTPPSTRFPDYDEDYYQVNFPGEASISSENVLCVGGLNRCHFEFSKYVIFYWPLPSEHLDGATRPELLTRVDREPDGEAGASGFVSLPRLQSEGAARLSGKRGGEGHWNFDELANSDIWQKKWMRMEWGANETGKMDREKVHTSKMSYKVGE